MNTLKFKRWLDTFGGSLPLLLLPNRKKAQSVETPRRIIIDNWVGIGDSVYLYSVAATIKAIWPDVELWGIVTERSDGVWREGDCFDKILRIDSSFSKLFPDFLRVLKEVRAFQPDVYLEFEHKLMFPALFARWSGAAVTAGFGFRVGFRKHAFSNSIIPDENAHMLVNYSRLAGSALSEFPQTMSLKPLQLDDDEIFTTKQKLNETVESGSDYVVLHPGCGPSARQRQWPPERFAAIADWIVERYGWTVLVSGATSEKEEAEALAGLIKNKVEVIAGKFTIREMAAVLRGAKCMVSVDTGILHLGVAMQVPAVGLFGPESPDRYGHAGKHVRSLFSGEECSPCIHPFRNRGQQCRDGACMKKLSIETVQNAITSIIAT